MQQNLFRVFITLIFCGVVIRGFASCPGNNFMVSSNSPVCVNTSLELHATGGLAYAWTGPNGFSSSDSDAVINSIDSLNNGTYYVTITGSGACEEIMSVFVVVHPLPFADVTSNGPLTNVCTQNLLKLECVPFITTSEYVNNIGVITADQKDCNCPVGYVVAGYTARTGSWLDLMGLVCKKMNSDGTLDPAIVYTDVNGGMGGGPNGPFIYSDNTALVGMSANIKDDYWFLGITGYGQDLSYILSGQNNSANPVNGPYIGGAIPPQVDQTLFVPDGAVVVGMHLYNRDAPFASTFSLNYRYVSDFFSENYLWSTGDTTPFININASGLYNLTVTNDHGCMNVSPDVDVTFGSFNVTHTSDTTVYSDGGDCGVNLNFELQVSGGCEQSIYSYPSPGDFFLLGTTPVIVYATDVNSNTQVDTFYVTVLDTVTPVLQFQPDIMAIPDQGVCGATIYFSEPTVTNECISSLEKTFGFTGTTEQWEVPDNVFSIDINAYGAKGGRNNWNYNDGGSGANVSTTLGVIPGQILYFTVGEFPYDTHGGFNGGGDGIEDLDWGASGGGGGQTNIGYIGDIYGDTILVAAGGGGAGVDLSFFCNNEYGGMGGENGGDGQVCHNPDGMGGTQTAGGNGYENGSYMHGGNAEVPSTGYGLGGGGGAGYYGGGSGHNGGGGGGSSFVSSVGTSNTTINSGYSYWHGSVTIYYTPIIKIIQTAGLSSGSVFPVGSTAISFLITDPSGNESISEFNVIVEPQIATTIDTTMCGNVYDFNGDSLTQSGTYSDTLISQFGCDSVAILNLTINHPNNVTDVQTACDSYTWIDGNTYTSSNNTSAYTLLNAIGCDSVVTLDLTITNSNSGTDVQTVCDSYTWIDGQMYTSNNNSATFTLQNAGGCDSVVTLDLTITNSNSGIDVRTVCDSCIWIDGQMYISSNNSATFTLQNAGGCDSVVTLNLTITNSNRGTDVRTVCDSCTWIDGQMYASSNNTAMHTLQNSVGCDSVVTLNLTVNHSSIVTDVQTACGSYTWIDGHTYSSSNNTATHTLQNSTGCDSVITLNLTVNQSDIVTDVQTACGSYTWIDGHTYSSSNNTATHTLQNSTGCDSVVTLNLTVSHSSIGTDVRTACNSFTWIDGHTYSSSNNTATHTLQNSSGCDSVVTLNLTVNHSSIGTDVQTACNSFTWIDGHTYSSSNNTATHTLQNSAGCDSVLTLNLTITQSSIGTDVQTACNSYTWIDGHTYTSNNNTTTHTLQNATGCDSVVSLNLTVNHSTKGTDVQSACNSLTWIDGHTYTANNNSATRIFESIVGCDSLVTLNLTINTLPHPEVIRNGDSLETQIFNSYQWLLNDAIIPGASLRKIHADQNGVYRVIVGDVNNCSDTSVAVNFIANVLNENPHIKLYPNPNNGTFTISSDEIEKLFIVITDLSGRQILEVINVYGQSEIQLSNLAEGVYIAHIVNQHRSQLIKFNIIR